MEKQKALLVFLLVLNILSWGQTLHRIGAIGCTLRKHICRPGEDCDREAVYPFGRCKRSYLTKRAEYVGNKGFRHSQHGGIDGNGGVAGEVISREGEVISREGEQWRNRVKDVIDTELWPSDRAESYENSKYDITYFENSDSFNEAPHKEHRDVESNELQQLNSKDNFYNDLIKPHNAPLGMNRNYVAPDSQQRREETLKQERSEDDSSPSISLPLEHGKYDDLTKPQHFKFDEDKEITHEKRTSESDRVKSKDENSLDLDIEIKPLSDVKYFDEDKSKHSSIPKKPTTDAGTPQKIEHIQTNFIDTSPEKKAKIDVLIGGQLNQAKTDIVPEKSPDNTYDNVKDFFKSQQVSSIVDAPVAEKKESVKFYSFPTQDKDVNVKRSSIPTPSVHPDGIRLILKERLNLDKASDLLDTLRDLLWGSNGRKDAFTSVETDDNVVLFHMLNNTTTNKEKPSSVVERINHDASLKNAVEKAIGVKVLSASLQSDKSQEIKEDNNFMLTTLIVAGCVTAILLTSVCIFIILKRTNDDSKWIPKQAGQEAASDYQSLWRQLRQATWESPIRTTPVAHADSGDQKGYFGKRGKPPAYSWSEEPVDTKMDISTGHVVLAYMEDHLKDENRLSREWEELSIYVAEPDKTDVGKDPKNSKKNRYSDVLPYDHNRVKLRETSNATGSDYINASYIIDDDPRNPAYIATQGPLGSTVSDFWQMVWEQGVVVIVMLTKLADMGLPQCHRYWPEKGHEVYHIYQVNLISEHIWCSDYLVRSFYLKNMQTGETRTVTQFHFLTWPHLGIPISLKLLLDFRRKVLKCFRGHASPIVVHCSGGIDRTGTYILIDMVLGKMSRGTKEIDISATLEHLRDQRPCMVKTKAQFQFALRNVAEEVNAILQVLTKH